MALPAPTSRQYHANGFRFFEWKYRMRKLTAKYADAAATTLPTTTWPRTRSPLWPSRSGSC
jgi:hypothetical protein